MNNKWIITNFITFLRVLATIVSLIVVYILPDAPMHPLFWGMTIVVYLTDILDGKLARLWNCGSVFGARMDIIADLFYILSNDIVLIWLRYMNPWLLVLVIVEFTFFLLTSMVKTRKHKNQVVLFDKIGRFTAGYYYLMPGIYWILGQSQQTMGGYARFANFICCILTIIALVSRGWLCWNNIFHDKSPICENSAKIV